MIRTYACPDDCGLGCRVQYNGNVLGGAPIPCLLMGRGDMYGWIAVDPEKPDCFGGEASPKCRRCKFDLACSWTYLHREAMTPHDPPLMLCPECGVLLEVHQDTSAIFCPHCEYKDGEGLQLGEEEGEGLQLGEEEGEGLQLGEEEGEGLE